MAEANQPQQANFTRNDLLNLVKEVMGLESVPPMIIKQINRFCIEDGMTYKEIGRCIVWFVEVEHGTLKPQYGIAIVPSVREAANKYFKQLELDQQRQVQEAQKIVEYQENNIIFNIKSLEHKKRKPKQLDISSINVTVDAEGEN